MSEVLSFRGKFIGELKKPDGRVITTEKDNLILSAGFDFIADAVGLKSGRPEVMGYIALGTSNADVYGFQYGLESEIARKAAIYSHVKNTNRFTITSVFEPGEATGEIKEAGVCNAAAGGTFLDRVAFDSVAKGADDTYTSTFEFTLSQK